tara:strand:- start:2513 stop:3085 length:573 start_codon:yes stop_codon:yes gene_type:complete
VKLLHSLLALTILSSTAFADQGRCRVGIKNLDKLLGNNSTLIEQVNRELDKKDVSLIPIDEVVEGDFSISNLVSVYNGIPNNPMYEYVFKTRSSVRLIPCTAIPLCSPISVDRKVTDIVGLKYKHPYTIQMKRNDQLSTIKYDTFKHRFKQEPTTLLRNEVFDGSVEQEDLALALVKEIPKCSKLKRLAK